MPPIRYQNPPKVFVRVQTNPIYGQKKPEVRIGKTLVAAGGRALRVKHYDMIHQFLKDSYGRQQQNIIDFYPTRAWCQRLPETKCGRGKGEIKDFIARIPAGKVLVHIPNIVSFNNFNIQHNTKALNHLAGILPNRCIVRSQFNHFPGNGLKQKQEERNRVVGKSLLLQHKSTIRQPRYCR